MPLLPKNQDHNAEFHLTGDLQTQTFTLTVTYYSEDPNSEEHLEMQQKLQQHALAMLRGYGIAPADADLKFVLKRPNKVQNRKLTETPRSQKEPRKQKE